MTLTQDKTLERERTSIAPQLKKSLCAAAQFQENENRTPVCGHVFGKRRHLVSCYILSCLLAFVLSEMLYGNVCRVK